MNKMYVHPIPLHVVPTQIYQEVLGLIVKIAKNVYSIYFFTISIYFLCA